MAEAPQETMKEEQSTEHFRKTLLAEVARGDMTEIEAEDALLSRATALSKVEPSAAGVSSLSSPCHPPFLLVPCLPSHH
jgi:hypothetical protein